MKFDRLRRFFSAPCTGGLRPFAPLNPALQGTARNLPTFRFLFLRLRRLEERMWHLTAGSPEPDVVEAEVRVVPALAAATQAVRVVVPAPATDVTGRT